MLIQSQIFTTTTTYIGHRQRNVVASCKSGRCLIMTKIEEKNDFFQQHRIFHEIPFLLSNSKAIHHQNFENK